ncbi:hypothetical protein Hanom_Chr00s000003g01603821 [Helianthus anomalus]
MISCAQIELGPRSRLHGSPKSRREASIPIRNNVQRNTMSRYNFIHIDFSQLFSRKILTDWQEMR